MRSTDIARELICARRVPLSSKEILKARTPSRSRQTTSPSRSAPRARPKRCYGSSLNRHPQNPSRTSEGAATDCRDSSHPASHRPGIESTRVWMAETRNASLTNAGASANGAGWRAALRAWVLLLANVATLRQRASHGRFQSVGGRVFPSRSVLANSCELTPRVDERFAPRRFACSKPAS